ncbi:MAG: hypothetical protein U0132_08455 [Gemmatimonadaceae bacterium]
MTKQKDFKRLVRARMTKTGEAYTAARAQLLRSSNTKDVAVRTSPSKDAGTGGVVAARRTPLTAPDYSALAGWSDETIKARTGCGWEKWVRALDHKKADQLTHGEIAALIKAKYKVDAWWSQAVTVGYERIKGLRAKGQKRDGRYEASKSRTYSVSVRRLFDAWADAEVRRRWLDGVAAKVRTATASKSMRLGWPDGSIVVVGFLSKGASKSSVAIAHSKLADPDAVQRFKDYWDERFDVLGRVLTESTSGGQQRA